MDESDRQDWAAYGCGEAEALDRIFRRHKDALFSYGLYMTWSREDAEDIVQETFVRLIRCKGKRIVCLRSWLFIAARNLTLNRLRTKPSVSLKGLEGAISEVAETRLFIERMLSKLAPEERELVLLREWQGFAVAELAEMMGLSNEAVRLRLYRVRKKMQNLAKEKT